MIIAAMSLAEIQAEISKLKPDERATLRQQLEATQELEDPAFIAELSRRIDEAKRGENLVTDEEFRALLRARGLFRAVKQMS